MEKRILVSHIDLDGYACNVIGRLIDPHIECYNVDYDALDTTINTIIDNGDLNNPETVLYITDLCPSEETLEKLNNVPCTVKLYDHHASALLKAAKYTWAIVEPKVMLDNGIISPSCGTYLFYKCELSHRYNNQAIKSFIELVRLWDTWEWKHSSNGDAARDLRYLFVSFEDKDEFVERMLHGYIIPEEDLMQLYDSDMEAINGLKEKEALAYEYALKSLEMVPATFNGISYTVGITIFTGYVSMVADMILETNEAIDILILINLQYNTISLRTKRTDIDLSDIASKYFNGGGHPQAAGASLTATKKHLIANAILGIIKE